MRGWDMAMETSLACSSAAAAALFAASFFSLSALPHVSVCRCSTSAAHAAFFIPGGLSLGARSFLAFGAPSSAILFGDMVVEEKRGATTVRDFGWENGYRRRILEGNEINGGELPFLSPTPRVRSTFRVFLFHPESPSAPRKAGDGLGSSDG
jgi:hypothetical protein